jgi:hypothetical protein
MNHLALVTSLKVSRNFPKIAGNFSEFYSDGIVDRLYNVTQLTGYLCFGFVYANVSGDPLCSSAPVPHSWRRQCMTIFIYLFIVVKHKEQLTATNMYRLKLN